MEETIAQAMGLTVLRARWGEVRAFQVKMRQGKSRQSAVYPKVRCEGAMAAMEVTVLIVATALCAEEVSVMLEGRSEHPA